MLSTRFISDQNALDFLSLLDESTIPDVPYLLSLKNPVSFLKNDIGKINFWYIPTFYQEVCAGFVKIGDVDWFEILAENNDLELDIECSKTHLNTMRLVEQSIFDISKDIPWYFDYSRKLSKLIRLMITL